ncbi:MAG: hypothetical protein EON56_04995 [Alphaproteobacteria bacterium]|nr:MAG: hypothetical protein EON56_04995 [Alphaproteobacteria bacterium]
MDETYRLKALDQLAAMRMLVKAMLLLRFLRKYDPNQPRAPAGQPDGGRWVNWARPSKVAGPYNEANRAKCETLYEQDTFQCSFVASARSRQACFEQAMVRHTDCMKGLPIPGLIYYLGQR